ncbi:hypothetical protein [Novipirellula artificiosorum]|uniref:Cytochrome c domain-containing protein n=1 Tax=Novipirellula artificiosorum TaxID=2528016 RepID=A0A5C6DMV6_9BACT|nr:hypothetical protein [Novipirellula artificiosorum]TWU37187.1 hypothetical protein Poly41_33140 [Novipirellula artificiosorum]
MKRLIVCLGLLGLLVSPAMAISEFGKQWKSEYLGEGANEDFVKLGRKAGCNVCHVKDEKKEEARNEYGKAVNEFLKKEDFPKDYVKENPEEAKKKIIEGFKKAGEKKSADKRTFAEKIKNNELPAVDAKLDD